MTLHTYKYIQCTQIRQVFGYIHMSLITHTLSQSARMSTPNWHTHTQFDWEDMQHLYNIFNMDPTITCIHLLLLLIMMTTAEKWWWCTESRMVEQEQERKRSTNRKCKRNYYHTSFKCAASSNTNSYTHAFSLTCTMYKMNMVKKATAN